MNPEISFVLPCHNEADALPEVLGRLDTVIAHLELSGVSTELLVVDDGSTDRSLEILLAHPRARVLPLEERGGYGAALKHGFSQARGQWITFFDLDRTYHPEDFPSLFERARATNADAVMGCRRFSSSGMPWTRVVGNLFFVTICRWFFRSPIEDMCTGFRILNRGRIRQVLELSSQDLSFSIQLTLVALLRGWRLEQVPISYEERLGSSKLSVVRDGFQFLFVILRYRWQQFILS